MKLPPGLIILGKRREYLRNQELARAQLEELQLRKFRSLVAHARKHSPYYADIIQTQGIDVDRCSPADFPVLTKTELMANFNWIVTDRRLTKAKLAAFIEQSKNPVELFLNKYFVVHTSGSSGEVGIFVYSQQDWARGFTQGGRLEALPKFLAPRKRVAFFGATDGHYAGVSFVSALQIGARKRHFDAIALEVNSPLSDVVTRLNNFQPDVLTGYVSGIKTLAERQRQGLLHIRPQSVSVGAEVLTETDRLYLQEAFGCPVQNVYACTEHMCIGASLPGSPSIHLWEDDMIFELAEDHVLTTNLFNYTLPLIRYRMSDVLIPKTEKSMPWPYTEIEAIAGRSEQTVRVRNLDGEEDFINPHTVVVSGLSRFQLQLLTPARIRFVACLESNLDAAQRDRTLAALRQRLDEITQRKRLDHSLFEISVTDDLPIDPITRKHRMVVDCSQKAGVERERELETVE